MLLGDYHVHSRYSAGGHAKGTVMEIALAAKEKGLKEVCISDHGMNHPFFGVRKKRLSERADEIAEANETLDGIRVFAGMETNFISSDGAIDSAPALDGLDVLIAGFHKVVVPLHFSDFFRMFCANFFSKRRPGVIKRNTDFYIKAIERYPIDIIAHPLRDCLVDLKEVGAAAAEKGTLIELNGHKIDLLPSDVAMLADIGCSFVLGSDAHRPENVADVEKALAVFIESGVNLARLTNWDNLPSFRSGKEIR